MFAVIRHYHFNPKDSAEIDRRVREDFVPIVKKAKGFVRYYWLDTGKGEGASVSVFRDKAGADESVHLAADYGHSRFELGLRFRRGSSRPYNFRCGRASRRQKAFHCGRE